MLFIMLSTQKDWKEMNTKMIIVAAQDSEPRIIFFLSIFRVFCNMVILC